MKKVIFSPIRPYNHSRDRGAGCGVFWDVYRFLLRDVRSVAKSFATSMSNLYHYFPIIWNDRDWDHSFLHRMLLFKLKRMRPALVAHTKREEYHDALDRCVLLMEEVVRRQECDCSMLGDVKCDAAWYGKCQKECSEMLKEVGHLFGKHSQHWWD